MPITIYLRREFNDPGFSINDKGAYGGPGGDW